MTKHKAAIGVVVVAVLLVNLGLAGLGLHLSPSGLSAATGSIAGGWWMASGTIEQAVRSLDSHHVAGSVTSPILAARLQKWMNYGFSFEGPWQPHELSVMLDVLDAYGTTLGDARFAQIIQAGVVAGTAGALTGITFALQPSGYFPSAAWYARSGQIRISSDIFNDAFMYQQYHWSFLDGSYASHSPDITIQHVVLGHEIGHVVIDGLNAEAVASSVDDASLEQVYRDLIPIEQWPHQGASVTENMATELSVWALGIRRTPQVAVFRTTYLRTTLAGPGWPTVVHARLAPDLVASAPR